MKSQITSKFNKDSFKLLNGGRDVNVADGDWLGVDEYIRDFMFQLNKSSHISTLYSCEGHTENDSAYMYFNVDEIGWDIFYQKIIPELSYLFCVPISTISNTDKSNMLYNLEWYTNITDNEYNTGISIYCILKSGHITWIEYKEFFWKVVKNTFLKYYNVGSI